MCFVSLSIIFGHVGKDFTDQYYAELKSFAQQHVLKQTITKIDLPQFNSLKDGYIIGHIDHCIGGNFWAWSASPSIQVGRL